MRKATNTVINASGGIFSARDALASLEAGASTVQIYAALIFRGPAAANRLAEGLSELLAERGSTVQALGRSAA